MQFFSGLRLTVWYLTTNVIEPEARLYNKAYKIHCKLPGWVHHCTALSQAIAFTFQNYIKCYGTNSYFQIKKTTVCLQALTALLPTPNPPNSESQDQAHRKTIMVKGLFAHTHQSLG